MGLNIKNTKARRSLREYMERDVWPLVPASELGRVLTREEEDRILGDGLHDRVFRDGAALPGRKAKRTLRAHGHNPRR